VCLDALPEVSSWNSDEPSGKVLAKLLSLPEKYKTVLYLYYFEEYSVKEISEMLARRESTRKICSIGSRADGLLNDCIRFSSISL
jgi:DNA-directed RNA polymerase specialized sigma24 family protein